MFFFCVELKTGQNMTELFKRRLKIKTTRTVLNVMSSSTFEFWVNRQIYFLPASLLGSLSGAT